METFITLSALLTTVITGAIAGTYWLAYKIKSNPHLLALSLYLTSCFLFELISAYFLLCNLVKESCYPIDLIRMWLIIVVGTFFLLTTWSKSLRFRSSHIEPKVITLESKLNIGGRHK